MSHADVVHFINIHWMLAEVCGSWIRWLTSVCVGREQGLYICNFSDRRNQKILHVLSEAYAVRWNKNKIILFSPAWNLVRNYNQITLMQCLPLSRSSSVSSERFTIHRAFRGIICCEIRHLAQWCIWQHKRLGSFSLLLLIYSVKMIGALIALFVSHGASTKHLHCASTIAAAVSLLLVQLL